MLALLISDSTVLAIIAAIAPTLMALAAFIKSIQNGADLKRNAEEGKARGEVLKSQVDELHGAMVSGSPTVVVTPPTEPRP